MKVRKIIMRTYYGGQKELSKELNEFIDKYKG